MLMYLSHLGRSLKISGRVEISILYSQPFRNSHFHFFCYSGIGLLPSESSIAPNRFLTRTAFPSVADVLGRPARSSSTIFEIPARISLIPLIQITLLFSLIGCEFRWRKDASPTKPHHTTNFFGEPGFPSRRTAHPLIA